MITDRAVYEASRDVVRFKISLKEMDPKSRIYFLLWFPMIYPISLMFYFILREYGDKQ